MVNLLTLESVPALQVEVRALAAERGAVILVVVREDDRAAFGGQRAYLDHGTDCQ